MAAREQKWRRTFVYIAVFYIWTDLDCSLCTANLFANGTQQTLCQAQCEALCLDRVPSCDQECVGNRQWVSKCNQPTCDGTCSVLEKYFEKNQNILPEKPDVKITLTGSRGIQLSWKQNSISPNLTTIYIIEQMSPVSYLPHIKSYTIIGWVRSQLYRINGVDSCSGNTYRAMAINRYGSRGFSSPVQTPALRPGLVRNIGYAGAGVYFYKDKDPSMSQFMAVLQWDEPLGWNASEIDHYEWNHMSPHKCQEISHDGLPIFHRMENQTHHVLLTIGAQSIGCTFKAQVRAISTCNSTGPWTNFIVDLTDCRKITGYVCQANDFDPPGIVENVSLSISATPLSVIMQWFKQPFTINSYSNTPLLVNLHVRWDPPTDMGSENAIDKYIIRSGRVKLNLFPLPPTFTEEPSVKNVSGNIRELIFQLPTARIPYLYGVQVVAVSPNQVIQPNEWGILAMYTIQVDRNDSLATLNQKGKILLDEAGIVIVYINNSLPVSYVLDAPSGKASNTTFDRYALQWGPLVGPDSNEMVVENKTVVPLNQSILLVYLQRPQKKYGIKLQYLTSEDEDPTAEAWDEVPTLTFAVPVETDDVEVNEISSEKSTSLLALYIVGPLVIVVLGLGLLVRFLHNKHVFKHLDRRLGHLENSDAETDEDGDRYFIMRNAGDQVSDGYEIPTVVTDRWELPHCCIKVGRILGSGAFGQVVKGRVSRSILNSRGLLQQGQQGGGSMHVAVAVKMLQECSEERYSRDFLKEIEMMKAIGYHRNIVSMLGCCTLREPFCLVVEHVPHGDLLSYVRKIRHKVEQLEEVHGSYVNQEVEHFTPQDLLSFARQIVTGMEYLSQKGFVHRDLAARNILVGDNSMVKIADFGLARYIYHDVEKVYINRHGGKLPFKWMAPESIFDRIFSSASDVWSFGIVLFEIVTLGAVPYPHLSNTELLQSLKERYIMEKPQNCSDEIYAVMKQCWAYLPGSRPSFSNLRETFTAMLEEDSGLEYFDFKVYEDRLYYRINSDEMDQEDIDGVAAAMDIADGVYGNPKEFQPKMTSVDLSQSQVVFEIPEDNCTVEEFSKSDNDDADPMTNDTNYSNDAFRRNASTTSSFHNELYQGMEDADRIIGPVAGDNEEESTAEIVERDTSSGTDDVFEDCQGCLRRRVFNASDRIPRQCLDCCKFDLHLNKFDIHVSDRIDSAIESDNSSGRYHTESSNSSVNSNEYLMPDSPIDNPSPSPNDLAAETPETFQPKFLFTGSPRMLYNYHFIDVLADKHSVTDRELCSEDTDSGMGDRRPKSEIMSSNSPADLLSPPGLETDKDIWSIAETKF